MARQIEVLEILNEELKKIALKVPEEGHTLLSGIAVVLVGKAVEATIKRLEEEGG